MDFRGYIFENYFMFNMIVFTIGVLCLALIASYHILASLLIALPLMVLISTITTAAYMIVFTNGRAIDLFLNDPEGGRVYLLESGIEFGLMGIVLAPTPFLLFWFFGKRETSQKKKLIKVSRPKAECFPTPMLPAGIFRGINHIAATPTAISETGLSDTVAPNPRRRTENVMISRSWRTE